MEHPEPLADVKCLWARMLEKSQETLVRGCPAQLEPWLEAAVNPSDDETISDSSDDGTYHSLPSDASEDQAHELNYNQGFVTIDSRPVSLPPIVCKIGTSPRFNNGFFEVSHSQLAGWGAIATKTLRRNDVILCERPLFISDAANLFNKFGNLDSRSRDVALSLHANRPKPSAPLIQAVWATNCFAVDKSHSGLFPVAARFNHACHSAQNVDFFYDPCSECLVLYVRTTEVPVGTELTISYGKGRTPLDLWNRYGFRCRCGVCPGLTEGDILCSKAQWGGLLRWDA